MRKAQKLKRLNEHYALVAAIRPYLAGHGPELQSSVLADLVAIWLCGHQGGTEDELMEARAELLCQFLKLVMELVPVNERILREARLLH